MTDLIPIGRFAQITHLSVKALRIYAHEGLLQPMYVDPESGYRYYTLAQAALAARIHLLRLVNMPLEEIRAVLQAPDPETVRMHLANHHRRITDRIARDQQSLLLLQRVRDKPDAFLLFTMQVKEVLDQPLLSLYTRAAPGTFGQAIRSAFGALITYTTETGVYSPDQPPLVIIHQYTPQGYQEGGTDFEVGLPVPRLVEGGQGIVSTLLPGGTVASVVHVGPYHELELIYPMLGAWIEEHGYVITGPPRNVILTNHAQVSHPAGYQTEVQWHKSPHEGHLITLIHRARSADHANLVPLFLFWSVGFFFHTELSRSGCSCEGEPGNIVSYLSEKSDAVERETEMLDLR